MDVGVHQDGLVHISALSANFVEDPHSVVKAGDIVKVKVMEVDIQRKRIALSMRLEDKASDQIADDKKPVNRQNVSKNPKAKTKEAEKPGKNGTFAQLFKDAKTLRK